MPKQDGSRWRWLVANALWRHAVVAALAIATIALGQSIPYPARKRLILAATAPGTDFVLVESTLVGLTFEVYDWNGLRRRRYHDQHQRRCESGHFDGRELTICDGYRVRIYDLTKTEGFVGPTVVGTFPGGADDSHTIGRSTSGAFLVGQQVSYFPRPTSYVALVYPVVAAKHILGQPCSETPCSSPLRAIPGTDDFATDDARMRLTREGKLEVVQTVARRAIFSASGARIERRDDGTIEAIDDRANVHARIPVAFDDAIALSPSGERIVARDKDRWRIIEWRTGCEARAPIGQAGDDARVLLSPDETKCVVIDSRNDWAIWDLGTLRPVLDRRSSVGRNRFVLLVGVIAIAWLLGGIAMATCAPTFPQAATWLGLASGVGAATLCVATQRAHESTVETDWAKTVFSFHALAALAVVGLSVSQSNAGHPRKAIVVIAACVAAAFAGFDDSQTPGEVSPFVYRVASASWCLAGAAVVGFLTRVLGWRVVRTAPSSRTWRLSIADLMALTFWTAWAITCFRGDGSLVASLVFGMIAGIVAFALGAATLSDYAETVLVVVAIGVSLTLLIASAAFPRDSSAPGGILAAPAIMVTVLLPAWLARRHGWRWRKRDDPRSVERGSVSPGR